MSALAGDAAPDSPQGRTMSGVRYGLLGLPLAFVALPLYVLLPAHYATAFGVPLAWLGLLLLAVRAFDAVLDPQIGRFVDRLLDRPRAQRMAAAAAAALLLALSFHALFFPPVRGTAALLAWAGMALVACYLAYSGLSVLHQAWGVRLGQTPAERAQVVA
jgi:glycoside/pentoside/hexuronide:cation symporter, GPH family